MSYNHLHLWKKGTQFNKGTNGLTNRNAVTWAVIKT